MLLMFFLKSLSYSYKNDNELQNNMPVFNSSQSDYFLKYCFYAILPTTLVMIHIKFLQFLYFENESYKMVVFQVSIMVNETNA